QLPKLNVVGSNPIARFTSPHQIAEKLYLSTKTVESHCAHIKKKLNLDNATELLQYAIKWANSYVEK
ncbi:MAG: response regulator transcription factor, partial [Planctomycetes bacterium]|nr:response regulator transcription factor [Planctomycetota bacterium]